jgi:hypothetical protein
MAIKDIQPPRQHTALDDDIAETEQALKDVSLWRRLIWAAIYATAIIEASLIAVAVATHAPNWDSSAQGAGTVAAVFGVPFALVMLYVTDSPCSRPKLIELTASLQRLKIQRKRTSDR